MNIPDDLKYTEEHEWIRIEGDLAVVGITDYAQKELGDIVYIELPEVGDEFKTTETFGTIEAVKTVSDLFSPVSGTVEEVNGELADHPEKVNQDPYEEGWMVKIKYYEVPDNLLSAGEYHSMVS